MFAFYDDDLPVSINNHVDLFSHFKTQYANYLSYGMGWMMDKELHFSLPHTQIFSEISINIFCLVVLFKQQFSLFKPHNTYTHTNFSHTCIFTTLKQCY